MCFNSGIYEELSDARIAKDSSFPGDLFPCSLAARLGLEEKERSVVDVSLDRSADVSGRRSAERVDVES